MYVALLGEKRFFGLLLRVDEDLAARAAGCRECGQAVHAGNFRRKARDVPRGLERDYEWRLSFCCARRECRKRLTPPSMRFLGRKVYLSAVVVLVSALRCGATPVRMARIAALVGVSRRTVNRWRQWWMEIFPQSRCWAEGSGLFSVPVPTRQLPLSLLERFAGPPATALQGLLRFVLPITGGDAAVRAM
jgi:hypothetical protein